MSKKIKSCIHNHHLEALKIFHKKMLELQGCETTDLVTDWFDLKVWVENLIEEMEKKKSS